MSKSEPLSPTLSPAVTPGQRKRRDMHKTSPNWQTLYREQCVTTLQKKRSETRSKLVDKFRNIAINGDDEPMAADERLVNELLVDEVMRSVWHECGGHAFHVRDQSVVSEFMEQIRQELIVEEAQYWEDLLEWRNKQELEWLLQNNLDDIQS